MSTKSTEVGTTWIRLKLYRADIPQEEKRKMEDGVEEEEVEEGGEGEKKEEF
jgi:hypothetical protein